MNTHEPVLNDPPATLPQSELRRGAVAALPVLLGFIPFALVLGAQVGPLLGDLRSYGFDIACAAVFLVLLKGMWRGVHAALAWLFSLITAALFYLLIPGGWYMLAGTVAGLVTAYLWAKPCMAVDTHLTRALGFLLLRNRTLGPQLTQVLNAAPGCLLIAVIAPKFVSGHPADLIALGLTVYAASRFSLLPVVVFAIVMTGVLRLLLPA